MTAATAPAAKSVAGPGERAGFVFLLIFVLLAAGIVSTGIFYYRSYEQHYRAEAENAGSCLGRSRG